MKSTSINKAQVYLGQHSKIIIDYLRSVNEVRPLRTYFDGANERLFIATLKQDVTFLTPERQIEIILSDKCVIDAFEVLFKDDNWKLSFDENGIAWYRKNILDYFSNAVKANPEWDKLWKEIISASPMSEEEKQLLSDRIWTAFIFAIQSMASKDSQFLAANKDKIVLLTMMNTNIPQGPKKVAESIVNKASMVIENQLGTISAWEGDKTPGKFVQDIIMFRSKPEEEKEYISIDQIQKKLTGIIIEITQDVYFKAGGEQAEKQLIVSLMRLFDMVDNGVVIGLMSPTAHKQRHSVADYYDEAERKKIKEEIAAAILKHLQMQYKAKDKLSIDASRAFQEILKNFPQFADKNRKVICTLSKKEQPHVISNPIFKEQEQNQADTLKIVINPLYANRNTIFQPVTSCNRQETKTAATQENIEKVMNPLYGIRLPLTGPANLSKR